MKFVPLRGDGSTSHYRETTPAKRAWSIRLPWVAITADGYGLIAKHAVRSKSGLTHLAAWIERDGVVDLWPMTICGINSNSGGKIAKLIQGRARIVCKRCLINAFLDLCREGRLGGAS